MTIARRIVFGEYKARKFEGVRTAELEGKGNEKGLMVAGSRSWTHMRNRSICCVTRSRLTAIVRMMGVRMSLRLTESKYGRIEKRRRRRRRRNTNNHGLLR